MKMSDQIDQLAAALSLFQGEVRDAQKDRTGYGYNYADLSQVLEIARPLMSKHGLALSQFPGAASDKITVESILMHKSGQWLSTAMEMCVVPGKMSLAQAAGSVITYMRRYAAAGILGITQTDNDAASESSKPDKTYEQKSNLQSPRIPTPRIDESQLNHLKMIASEDRIVAFMQNVGIQKPQDITVPQYNSILDKIRLEDAARKKG